jgi:hypothetical protein
MSRTAVNLQQLRIPELVEGLLALFPFATPIRGKEGSPSTSSGARLVLAHSNSTS